MVTSNKEKLVISIGISAVLFYTSFTASTSCSPVYKFNELKNIYTSIRNYLSLEQTPDQISRNYRDAILQKIIRHLK